VHFAIYPCLDPSSSFYEIYNSVPTTHDILKYSDCTFMFENAALPTPTSTDSLARLYPWSQLLTSFIVVIMLTWDNTD
jgi:hypothetical protein